MTKVEGNNHLFQRDQDVAIKGVINPLKLIDRESIKKGLQAKADALHWDNPREAQKEFDRQYKAYLDLYSAKLATRTHLQIFEQAQKHHKTDFYSFLQDYLRNLQAYDFLRRLHFDYVSQGNMLERILKKHHYSHYYTVVSDYKTQMQHFHTIY